MRFFALMGILLNLIGCAAEQDIKTITPDPNLPGEVYSVSYGDVRILGLVWSFEDDGNYVNFGGPIAGKVNGIQSAVVVEGPRLSLVTARSVLDADKETIQRIIAAAIQYCELSGLVRSMTANINTDGNRVNLVQFCSP